MISSIRATIRAFVAPDHRLSCPERLWQEGLRELARRGGGRRESGAFLLGRHRGKRRAAERFAYYDDFDPDCLDSGIVVFDGSGYGPLWELCRATGLSIVADVHTHGGRAIQSHADRANPMVARPAHVALIVPRFAQCPVPTRELGCYEYAGGHRWHDHTGKPNGQFLYIGRWG